MFLSNIWLCSWLAAVMPPFSPRAGIVNDLGLMGYISYVRYLKKVNERQRFFVPIYLLSPVLSH